MRVLVAALVIGAFLALAGSAAAEDPAHRRLAEHYAPVVFQESRSAVLDYITNFDFDGDWRGDNNWRNAYLFDLPGYVYYSVIESSRHYFITYAFYHPRDYTATPYEGFAPKTEHENDMEGCTVTIEKDGTPFGTAIVLQTLAHDVFFKYDNRDVRRVTAGAAKLDGPMTFVDGRPAVYIEPEGHGVKAAAASAVRDPEAFAGLVYRYTGLAGLPRSNQDKQATYDLISIEDTLWAHRFDVGTTFCCADAYLVPGGGRTTFGSTFNGPIGGCAAKPPWGWDQRDDALAKGDWFRDPLRAYMTQLRIQGFSGSYVHNPYLAADVRTAAPLCRQAEASKTVRGSLLSTLFGIGRAVTADGLGREQVGGRARQLFLGNAVLLEWAGSGFEGGSFVSPMVSAPSRYFDSVVLRYRTPLEGLTARVAWVYDAGAEFSNDLSATVPLPEAPLSGAVVVRLSDSPRWDRNQTVQRVRVTIESATGTVATATPGNLPDSDQLAISQIVFDRDAFSNTFEQQQ